MRKSAPRVRRHKLLIDLLWCGTRHVLRELNGCYSRTSRSKAMKISARNTLAGVVRKIEPGAVNAEITLEVAPDISIVSIITLDAVKALGLKVGNKAYAVIKASSVMIGVD